MQVLKLFRDSITNFNSTIRSAYMKISPRLFYMFILAVVLSLPYFMNSIQIVDTITKNGEVVAQQIPDFSIQDGKVKTDNTDPFIYETDFFIYAYDPQDKITFQEAQNINPLALVIETGSENQTFSIASNSFAISNSQLNNGFNQDDMKAIISSTSQITWWIYPLMFVIFIAMEILYVAILALFVAIFTNFIVQMRKLPLSFKERFNLALPAITLPIILVTILKLFNIMIPFQFEIILIIAVTRTYFMLKHTKVITVNRKDLKDDDKDN